MTTCPKCGMGYDPGASEYEKEDKRYHDRFVNGVPASSLRTDERICQELDRRITVVTAHSPDAQRKRAEAVASVAKIDTNYYGDIYHAAERPDERDIQLFLYNTRNKITGITILERRTTVWRSLWRSDDKTPDYEELPGHEPMWSVVFVWMHATHRNQGAARPLVEEALKHLGINLHTVGWCTPFTDAGRAFAKSLCPDEFYVAK